MVQYAPTERAYHPPNQTRTGDGKLIHGDVSSHAMNPIWYPDPNKVQYLLIEVVSHTYNQTRTRCDELIRDKLLFQATVRYKYPNQKYSYLTDKGA